MRNSALKNKIIWQISVSPGFNMHHRKTRSPLCPGSLDQLA